MDDVYNHGRPQISFRNYSLALPWLIPTKYFIITCATVVAGLPIYQLGIRPYNVMRVFFSMKARCVTMEEELRNNQGAAISLRASEAWEEKAF